MKGMYQATSSVWRPEGEHNMGFMLLSQFLFAAVLALIYTGVGKHLPCKKGIQFGFSAGLLLAMPQLGTFCYLPIPLKISLLWMVAALLKGTGCGFVIAQIYKEK